MAEGDDSRKQFELDDEGAAIRRRYNPFYASAVTVSQAAPKGVLCLFSALELFGVARNPTAWVWLAVPNKARVPSSLPDGVRVLRFSDETLAAGRRKVVIDKLGAVSVHTPAKAIVDCFKYRLKLAKDLGIEVAELLGLLKDMTGLHKRHSGPVRVDAIRAYLDVCRMRTLIGPYLDALDDPRRSTKSNRK